MCKRKKERLKENKVKRGQEEDLILNKRKNIELRHICNFGTVMYSDYV